ncbi:hypothetical protein IQ249_15240 [Lusitaniella coriacea LEGE 07157]|uniref:Uncharacterized protein n=1 Tax=Lusitaniella coriacea LEGE 07157 TaxID=945747 RepID=A0A8J7E0U9_9CYAN|nr:hypothetical protein [Lusitaniella coriacea]MBE9117254.1 hypothetical protein [Lusitaniella coriacea LEGE 07157]
MTNNKRFTTTEQERRERDRFLALCFESIRESGQCSYPPLVALFKEYEAQKTAVPSPLEGVNIPKLQQQITSSHKRLLGAAQYLQNLKTWDCSPQIQQVVQVIAQEAKALEMLAQPLFPADSPGASALKRLDELRDYLLQKLSDTHFLSPQGLRAEQPMIFIQQHRRIYKYLSQLQAATNEVIECLNFYIQQYSETEQQ